MARRAVVAALVLLAMGAALRAWADDPQSMPLDARGFLDWCQQRGLDQKDSHGGSCRMVIEIVAAVASLKSTACQTVGENASSFARPIYEWLVAHPDQIHGDASDAIRAALKALYGCSA